MKIRFRIRGLLMASACAGMFVAVPLVGAPSAFAACPGGQVQDPITGLCWTSNSPGMGSSYGTCLPGRLGLCLGALQNQPVPGAALSTAPPAGPAPRTSWP